jgi:hypothetical protein
MPPTHCCPRICAWEPNKPRAQIGALVRPWIPAAVVAWRGKYGSSSWAAQASGTAKCL